MLFFTAIALTGMLTTASVQSGKELTDAKADTLLIIRHLKAITKTDGYRNYRNLPALNATAEYIFHVFAGYADTVFYQPYEVQGKISDLQHHRNL